MFFEFEILVDIPLVHPLGDQIQHSFTHHRTEERENVRMANVFPRYSFLAESLSQTGQPQFSGTNLGKVRTHTERFIGLLRNVEPDNFDGNSPTPELALKYLGRVHILRRLQSPIVNVLEFHRIWD